MPVTPLEVRYNVPSQMDPDQNPTFELPTPIAKTDTSKIHLYEKIDSLWYRAKYNFGAEPGKPRSLKLVSAWDESYLVENEVQLTVSFNGKARFQMTFPADATKEDIEKKALEDERSQHYIDGKTIVKIIVVPKKIINIVCK